MSKYNPLPPETAADGIKSIEEEKLEALSKSAAIGRTGVPESHRRAADNYMVIKKIYGSPVVKLYISHQERSLLLKYDFNPLEYSTIKQINEEISFLKRWSAAPSSALKKDADEIIQIRAKELKCISALSRTNIKNGIYNGYQALERYFEEITKYKF